jgi:hypothetical protein
MIGKNATLEVEIPGYGLYACTVEGMDWALTEYRTQRPEHLKRMILARWMEDNVMSAFPGARDILNSVTECLIVLAYLEGYGV